MATLPRASDERPTLDRVDRHIISALQEDGRRPYSQIARDLDMSESSVRYRVGKLEASGIVQVVGIANPLRIGFDIIALLGIHVERDRLPAVSEAMAQLPETSYVATTAGSFDLFVEVICRDTAHFSSLLTEHVRSVPGVVDTQSFLVLDIHKMAYGWGVGEPPDAVTDDR